MRYFTVENAGLYTLPDQLPPLLLAASGSGAAELAARLGNGLIGGEPNTELVQQFAAAGGAQGWALGRHHDAQGAGVDPQRSQASRNRQRVAVRGNSTASDRNANATRGRTP